ncbi:MAG: protein jag, partial [Elusimicrobia bacterium]|nr:protein jag [Elusimicrobiota bacterium]
QIETAGYWEEREESILTVVHQAIEEVKRTGKLVRLQPMDSSLRRMIHRALAESPDVDTVSEGEGAWRKVVLRPKKR